MKPEFMNDQPPLVGEKPDLKVFDGPGTGTSDSIHTTLPEEGFVITAAAMQKFGPQFFQSLIAAVPPDPAGEESGEQHMEVQVSDGEGYIPPEVVEYYGVEFFDKILEAANGDMSEQAEPLVGEEPQEGPEEPMEEDGYKKGGCIPKLFVGGRPKDEEQRNGPLTQPEPDPITKTPAPTSGPTQSAASAQQSTDRDVMARQAGFGTQLDNPTPVTNIVNSAKNAYGKLDQTVQNTTDTPFTAVPDDLLIGKDSQKTITDFGNQAIYRGGQAIDKGIQTYKDYQNDPGNKGDSGLNRALVGGTAGIMEGVKDLFRPAMSDPAVQKVLTAEAARNDFNSPSFVGDPRNSPDYNNPSDRARMGTALPNIKDDTGGKGVTKLGQELVGGNTQSQQTQTQDAVKETPTSVNKTIEAGRGDDGASQPLVGKPAVAKRQGPATIARAEVLTDQPPVGDTGPMAPDNQKRFPGDDRYYDYSNIEDPNVKGKNPWVKDLGVVPIGNGKYQDVSGEVLFKDPKGQRFDEVSGEWTSGYTDRYGRPKWIAPPDEFAPKGTQKQQQYMAGLDPAQRNARGSYIMSKQLSDDPNAQAASIHYNAPEKTVYNLSGNENWNVGWDPNTPENKAYLQRHPSGRPTVTPWYNAKEEAIMAGKGPEYMEAEAKQQQVRNEGEHYKNVDANTKEEARLRELDKWVGKGSEKNDDAEVTTNPSGEEESKGHQKKRVAQQEFEQSIVDGDTPFNRKDDRHMKIYTRILGTPVDKRTTQDIAFIKRLRQQGN